jgi:hypothetical protein
LLRPIKRSIERPIERPLLGYQELISTVVEKSDGIFLWVRLVCDRLRKGSRKGESLTSLRKALVELPTNLFELYKNMFDEIEKGDRHEAHELLGIISAASRTLTLSELRCIISFNPSTNHDTLSSLVRRRKGVRKDHEHFRLPRRIDGICGGLIETRPIAGNFVVMPIHATTRAFLVKRGTLTQEPCCGSLISDSHLTLLHATTKYLQALPFKHSHFQFRTENGKLLFFCSSDQTSNDGSLPSSQWSMTTAACEG